MVGAVLMLVSSALTWATVDGPAGSITVNGFNTDGYVTDVFAVVFIVLGLLVWRGGRTLLSVATTVVGVLAVGWGILVVAAISNFSSLYPDTTAEGITVAAGVGVYTVLVGTVLGLIGAIASFPARRATAPAAVPAPPPSAPPAAYA